MNVVRTEIIYKVEKAEFANISELNKKELSNLEAYGFYRVINSTYYIDIDYCFSEKWNELLSQINNLLKHEIRDNKLNELLT